MSVKTCSYGNELEFVAKCQTRRDDRLTSTYETGNIPFRLATRPSNQLSSTRRVNTTSSPLFSDSSMACEFFLEILFEEIGRLRSQGLFLRNFFPKNRPWKSGADRCIGNSQIGRGSWILHGLVLLVTSFVWHERHLLILSACKPHNVKQTNSTFKSTKWIYFDIIRW